MAGIIPTIGRQGNRLEYLAHYILSKLGAASSVPRPEDIGIDFYCTLGEAGSVGMTMNTSFAVQLKAGKKREFILGGSTNGGKWRDYELKWFFELETPLLLGVPDEENKRLDLYTTSVSRFVLNNERLPYELVMEAPNIENSIGPLHPPEDGVIVNTNKDIGVSDGKRWTYNLGPPIVRCSINDLDDPNKVECFTKRIKEAVYTERLNAIYQQLGLPYWIWTLTCKTNVEHTNAYCYGINKVLPKETKILSEIVPFISALALTYKSQGRNFEFDALKPIARLLPDEAIPFPLRKQLGDLLENSDFSDGFSGTDTLSGNC